MADEQVSILITAIDDVSKKLDNIKKNVEDMTSNSAKQTKSLSEAFSEAQGNLLILGNTASRVDSIFDSYANMQLRVENASTRVYEAQKNVRDAQYALSKTMKDSSAAVEDVAKAKDDLETANNRLMMSQNNLERTNNAVTGTYIQMGMSIVTVIASIPNLIVAVNSLTTAAIAFCATPLGMTLLAVAAAGTALAIVFSQNRKETEETKVAMDSYNMAITNLTSAEKELEDSAKRVNEVIKETNEAMAGRITTRSEEELQALKDRADAELNISKINQQMGTDDLAFATTKERLALEEQQRIVDEANAKIDTFTKARDASSATLAVESDNAQKGTDAYAQKEADWRKIMNDHNTWVKDVWGVTYKENYDSIYQEDLANFQAAENAKIEKAQELADVQSNNSESSGGTNIWKTLFPNSAFTRDVTDELPAYAEGGIVSSPQIAMVGEAGPEAIIPLSKLNQSSGPTIVNNFYGNNYGVNAEEIALAFNDKLGTMVRTW